LIWHVIYKAGYAHEIQNKRLPSGSGCILKGTIMYKNVFIPLVLLSVLVLKLTILNATIGDALAVGFLAALCGFKFYLDANVPQEINAEIRAEIETLKSTLNALKISKTYGKLG